MGWVAHTVVDVALGLGLLIAGVHGNGADYYVLDAAGAYLLAITAVTDARGGLWRRLPRVIHRVIDGAVSLAMVASPFIALRYHVHLDLFATIMAEAVGIILLRDAVVSEHHVPEPSIRGRSPGYLEQAVGGSHIDVKAFETGLDSTARKLGVVAGKARRLAVSRRAGKQ
ncbi:MAG: hypothetical protein ACYDGN_13170 [Acidimicrobiales bacterium]